MQRSGASEISTTFWMDEKWLTDCARTNSMMIPLELSNDENLQQSYEQSQDSILKVLQTQVSSQMLKRSKDDPGSPTNGRRITTPKKLRLESTLLSRIQSVNTTPTRSAFSDNDECLLRSTKKYNSWTAMTPHSASQRYLSTRGGSYDVCLTHRKLGA